MSFHHEFTAVKDDFHGIFDTITGFGKYKVFSNKNPADDDWIVQVYYDEIEASSLIKSWTRTDMEPGLIFGEFVWIGADS